MKVRIYLLLVPVVIALSGCNNKEVYFISPKDKSQSITVITHKYEKIRYIINGKHSVVPDTNYVKIDIGNIDSLGDALYGCWEYSNNGWKLALEGAIIIENKLDTTRFKFNDKLPRDEWNIPRVTKYVGEKCFSFDYLTKKKFSAKGNTIIE